MVCKLTKQGDAWAFIVDQSIRDLMDIDADTLLHVSLEGRRLIIEPISDEQRSKKLQKALEETNLEYGSDLRNLAK